MMWIHRLVSDEGFIQVFWDTLRETRKTDPSVTPEQVYDALNAEYREAFGCDRFKSFDAFRKRRDKR